MSDPDVLLVEDNRGDVRLVEDLWADRGLPGTLHVVHSGADALDWVFGREEYESEPRPDLLLVDLNLPGTGGHDVVDAIKSDPDRRRLPVIVLTGSQSEAELDEALAEHANACVVKPADPETFGDRLETTAEFWLSVAAWPTDAGDGTDPAQ